MEHFNTIIIIIGLLWEVWYCSIVLRPYLLHHQVTGIWKYLPHKRRCDHQTAENTLAAVSLEKWDLNLNLQLDSTVHQKISIFELLCGEAVVIVGSDISFSKKELRICRDGHAAALRFPRLHRDPMQDHSGTESTENTPGKTIVTQAQSGKSDT